MYQIYMDPEFTAYRMDAFIDILQNGGDLEALALASDKRRSDTFCHNMCFAMSHGIPPMEYARMYDEPMEADWEPNR